MEIGKIFWGLLDWIALGGISWAGVNVILKQFNPVFAKKDNFVVGWLGFSAAMSSSRSDVVTKCVFLSVPFFFLLVSLEFYLILKCFNGVLRKFRGCLKF